jgi:phage terminase large subunit-like protein
MFSQQQLLETFSELSTNDKIALEWRLSFLAKAHSYQLMPNWAWTVWLLCGGRGCGKTWTASNQVGWLTWEDSKSRILVMAPTANDIRFTCFEGESGLLNVIPHQLIKKYNKSLFELELVNGGQLRGISADSYERLRGPQWSACWMDELAAYEYLQEAWDMAMFGLRLGKHPRVIATTTPKPKPLITNLLERDGKDVAVNRATSYANLDNLAPTFKAQITQYEGTKLGRQEIHAEIIDPFEAGVIKKAWIKMWGAETPLPPLQFVLYSLDTAFTEKTAPTKEERRRGTYEDRDPTACSVWGVFVNKKTHRQEIILLDCWEDYLGLPELIVRVKRELKQSFGANLIEPLIAPKIKSTHPHPTESQGRHPDLIIIEDKGSGISLRQMLAREGIRAYPYVPTTDKLERLHSVSHIFYHGCIWMPESEKIRGRFKSWTNTLIEQLCSYAGEGSIAHDDALDACTQALIYLANSNHLSMTVMPEVVLKKSKSSENVYSS